ncbi:MULTISPECIES: hypothetical protein [Streptomyces]|uniref:Uncharacterized protein n=1 Tax=Streptomyces ramulosus TaxID=47762 RepID=A0ABW1FIE2_9ACTN
MSKPRDGERAPKEQPAGRDTTRREALAEEVRRLNRWSSGGGGRR